MSRRRRWARWRRVLWRKVGDSSKGTKRARRESCILVNTSLRQISALFTTSEKGRKERREVILKLKEWQITKSGFDERFGEGIYGCEVVVRSYCQIE